MATGTARTWWQRLRVLLIVTSGVALAWTSARRRPVPVLPARTWSQAPVAPLAAHPAPPRRRNDADATVSEEPATVLAEAGPASEPVEHTHVFEPPEGPQPGPYPGSALPLADGSAPSAEFVIKGNAGSKRCHSPSSPYFARTRAEVWFRTQEDAVAAGFRPWAPKA